MSTSDFKCTEVHEIMVQNMSIFEAGIGRMAIRTMIEPESWYKICPYSRQEPAERPSVP